MQRPSAREEELQEGPGQGHWGGRRKRVVCAESRQDVAPSWEADRPRLPWDPEVLDNYQFMGFVECLSVSAACVLCRLPGECVAPAPEPWPHPADSGFLPPFQTCFLGAPSQSLDPSRVLRPC